MGEWGAAFGRQEATHTGEFMGIAPTGKRVHIRYMDFWKVVDGKIVDNYVSVDFPHVMAQLGKDKEVVDLICGLQERFDLHHICVWVDGCVQVCSEEWFNMHSADKKLLGILIQS